MCSTPVGWWVWSLAWWAWHSSWLLGAPAFFGKCIFDDVQSRTEVVAPPPHEFAPPTPAGATPTASKSPPPCLPGVSPNQPAKLSGKATSTCSGHKREYRQLAPSTKPIRRSAWSAKREYRQLAPSTKPIRRSGWSAPLPIRIRMWVPQESPTLSQMERERLEAAVNEAVRIVSDILSVNRVPGRLLLSRDINKYCRFIWSNTSATNYNKCGRANEHYRGETCLDVTIPDDHLSGCAVYHHPDSPISTVLRPEGAGLPDTDFLLYVHTQSTDKCRAEPSVLAYAVHCQTDRQGRPLAGVVVICRDRLRREGLSHQSTVQTVIHELFHALGFSKELFNTWKDCSYTTNNALDCSPWGQVTNTDDMGQVRLYTPSVIRALQTHLNSSEPQLGGMLENQDVRGVSSHWEARVLQGSIMGAVLGDPALVRVDPVTLAALQDTGWYSVDHSKAQPLEWGEGQGALFGSLSTCHENSSFFCTGSGSGCHYLHFHKGECQSDEYLEGCRMYKPLSNSSGCWDQGNERVSGEEEWSGEIYHSDSRCFFSNLSRESLSSPLWSSVVGRCYRHRCTGLNQFQIKVSSSDWVNCPAGAVVQVPGYRGSVFCPDRRLCQFSLIAPPTSQQAPPPPADPTLSSSPTESEQVSTQQHVTASPGQTLDPDPSCTVISVLGGMAALSLLVVLYLAYRGQRSSRVRVHAAAGDPASEPPPALQLQPAFCLTKHC